MVPPVEGEWVDRIVGLEGVRLEAAMLETPDGHGRLELVKFDAPASRQALSPEPREPLWRRVRRYAGTAGLEQFVSLALRTAAAAALERRPRPLRVRP
jgi:hypothetical protein